MSTTDDGEARAWDGLPIRSDLPYGATIVVYRVQEEESGRRLVLRLGPACSAPD